MKRAKKVPEADNFIWQIRSTRKSYRCEVTGPCPFCHAHALTGIPEGAADTSDGTNVVCHPNFGGCNQGFHHPMPPAVVLVASVDENGRIRLEK